MDVEKYKKYALIIIVVMFILLLIYVLVLPNKDAIIERIETKKQEGISTANSPFDISDYENDKLVQDFLNPTAREIADINERYGYENVSFDENGLNINYNYGGRQLMTDIWPDTLYTRKYVNPELEIYLLMASDNYLTIELVDVEKSDIEGYIQKIKDEYSDKLDLKEEGVIYKAKNARGTTVTISYDPETFEAIIKYEEQK